MKAASATERATKGEDFMSIGAKSSGGVLTLRRLLIVAAVCGLVLMASTAVRAAEPPPTVIDQWAQVTPPAPPPVQAVTVKPQTTALLILDIETRTCNREQHPRCLDTQPNR